MGDIRIKITPDDKAEIYFTIEAQLSGFLKNPTSMFIETLKQLQDNGLLNCFKVENK